MSNKPLAKLDATSPKDWYLAKDRDGDLCACYWNGVEFGGFLKPNGNVVCIVEECTDFVRLVPADDQSDCRNCEVSADSHRAELASILNTASDAGWPLLLKIVRGMVKERKPLIGDGKCLRPANLYVCLLYPSGKPHAFIAGVTDAMATGVPYYDLGPASKLLPPKPAPKLPPKPELTLWRHKRTGEIFWGMAAKSETVICYESGVESEGDYALDNCERVESV